MRSVKVIARYDLENRLIAECAQRFIPDQQIKNISDALNYDLDWNYIFKISVRNAVFPVVCWNLLNKFPHLLPDEIRNTLNEKFQTHLRKNMFLTGRLIELVKLFESNNIPILPFKGPLLAMRAYKNLALRQFGDLDVLIRPNDFDKAIDLLSANGFEPVNSANWLKNNNWRITAIKDVSFINTEHKFIVEVHWKLSGSHFALPIEMNRMWNELESVNVAGTRVNALSFNDLLIYLCLHGSRHSWERFGWICDIHELIESQSEIDYEELTRQAQRLGCEKVLELGLYLVYRFFNKKYPLPNWQRIENDSTLKDISDQIQAKLFAEEPNGWEIGDRYAYHLKLREKLWDRWKLHLHYNFWYLKIIFTPNKLDRDLLNLPSFLVPLYYVMRPTRLLYTYVYKPKKLKAGKINSP
jgi:hypothetical protein